jgi:hypothetical protein
MPRIRRRNAVRAVLATLLAGLLAGCGGGGSTAEHAWDPDSIPDAFAQPTAALVWPGLTHAYLVGPDGSLENGLWRVRFDPSCDGALAAPPAHIACEDRWLPVIRWTRRSADVRWEFEAVAFPARSPSDSALAVSVRVRVVNEGSGERRVRLAAVVDSSLATLRFIAADGASPTAAGRRWATSAAADSSCGWTMLAASGAQATGAWTLAPGGKSEARFVLPATPLPARDLARVAARSHAARVTQVRAYWQGAIARGARFELGDTEAENALRAAQVVLLGCREHRGGRWLPIGGPFQYRDVWLRDGARVVQALALGGHVDEARQLAAGIAPLQWPEGAYLTQRGQLDGTGQALWAFEQAALRPAAARDVAALARRAIDACAWIEAQRDLGKRALWPLGNLMPYADPKDGEQVMGQLTGNDFWSLAGYRAAARLCGAAGLAADSARIETQRRAYAAEVLAALDHVAAPDVPACWKGGGRDWGNLVAAWPAAVLDPGDARCERLARRLWARAGGAGMVCYGPVDTLQSYVGADLGVWAMLDDRPLAADSVLDALLHWRNGSGAGAELFSRSSRDFGLNLPPHPTSAAALVALVRHAVLYDDADTLMLTLAAKERWWRGARVSGAPTRWGTLDLTFRREGDAARWTWTPVPVWTRLRVPQGFALAVAPPPPLRGEAGSHFVLAPPRTGAADVRLAADGATR